MFSRAMEELSGNDRILRAAIEAFGRDGVRATSLKTIAAAAGVSPALIVHHFGSKDALREACDRTVTDAIRTYKSGAMQEGSGLDLLTAMALVDENRPLLRYLAKALVEGNPHINELIDDLIRDAEGYTAEAERAGLIRPSADPHARMVVLTLWSLGTLVLHEQLERLLGADLLGEKGDVLPYIRTALEIFSEGVFMPGAFEKLKQPGQE